ncbi:MAG: hypothetical protein HYU36_03240 [Planctomycetes bacterium]|nr:hypothetical protein [Planctomycetota bacterium]
MTSKKYSLSRAAWAMLLASLFHPGQAPKAQEETAQVRSPEEETKIERAKQLLNQLAQQEQVRRKEREFMAQHFYENGQKFFNERLYKEALQSFRKALDLDPKHEEARKMAREARRLAGMEASMDPESILERMMAEKKITEEMTKDELDRILVQGRELLDQGKTLEAADAFDEAISLARWIPKVAGVEALAKEASESLARCRQALQEQEIRRDKEASEQARAVLSEETRRQRSLVETRTRMMLNRARAAMESENYILAMNLIDELLAVDPLNAEVRELKGQLQRIRSNERQERATSETKTGGDELMTSVTEASKPENQLAQFPANWGDIAQKRPTSVAPPEEVSEWKKGILQQMEKRVSFDFVDTPLQDVMAFLQNLTGVNIVLDPQATGGGDASVTLRVNDMRLSAAMEWILRLVNLKYVLRDEAIYISTSDRLEEAGVMRIYDVRDLLAQIPDFQGTGLPTISEGGGGGGGGGDGGLFGDEGGGEEGITGDDLVEFIRETVAPNSWGDGEGGP